VQTGVKDRVDEILDHLFPSRRIRRVLLIHPPDGDASLFDLARARRKRITNFPPYGLAVLARHLLDHGIEVEICNLNHAILKAAFRPDQDFDFDCVWQTTLDAAVDRFRPDLIGISCLFTMTHTAMRNVCDHLKPVGIPLALGGVHVTNDVERVLDDIPSADMAFLREGDKAIIRFIDVVNREAPTDSLVQLVLNRPGERRRLTGEALPDAAEISVIPAYELLQIEEYSDYGRIGPNYCFRPEGTRFATVLSNRGCRARCTFCSVRNFNGTGVRQRSIESVLEEIKILYYEHGVRHIMWLDDDLLKDHERAIRLFDEITALKLDDFTWDASNGVIAASCTEEVVSAAARSGCIGLHIGMESGNPKVLREVHKPGTVANFLKAAEVLKAHPGIYVHVFLIIGFPGETLEMILDTVNVSRQMDLDWYIISVLQPLPNTPMYDLMVSLGLLQSTRDTRYMIGAYGTSSEVEKNYAALGFEEAFATIPLDAVPSRAQLNDIWFYMDYHLNYHRLFFEERPEKIRQSIQHLKKVANILLPDHPFALYFLGYLEMKTTGRIDPEIVSRLEGHLQVSAYWRERMRAFGLDGDDLRSGAFKNREIPRFEIRKPLPDPG
jgi:radical SAM superfamily enzyme YgiQ (UPF0313 family)